MDGEHMANLRRAGDRLAEFHHSALSEACRRAGERIAALEAERDAWRVELEAARTNAERYRWLREDLGDVDRRDGADVTGPVYITDSGLRAVRHDDGTVGVIVEDARKYRSALHLSVAQAAELDRFFRTIHPAGEPPSILDQAREIVAGARQQTHGSPERNSEAIALVWSALLVDLLKPGARLSPALVNLMMVGLKLVRASKDPAHRDHHMDAVGYLHLNEVCGYLNPK